ncbi:hypothetical protein MAR_021810, partial [Mya arenaria]
MQQKRLQMMSFNSLEERALLGQNPHNNFDTKLKKTETGREYLVYNERRTKSRTGQKRNDLRLFKPKQFAHDSNDTCPVFACKGFSERRSNEIYNSESPFNLGVNKTAGGLMKSMAGKANITGKKTNHSVRKTTCTKLLHSGVAPTVIKQLTGPKNVQRINNYAVASLKQQRH